MVSVLSIALTTINAPIYTHNITQMGRLPRGSRIVLKRNTLSQKARKHAQSPFCFR